MNHSVKRRSIGWRSLYMSAVNFIIKLLLALLAGDKAAKHSGSFRYKLTQWIANKTIKFKPVETEAPCPLCKGTLKERASQYGKFIGCSNYPQCRYTHKLYQ